MSVCLKIDEDLPRQLAGLLIARGHDALTVVEQGWQGVADDILWSRIQSERRWLITADKGFADLRQHPPGNHAGVILLRPQEESRRAYLELASVALGQVNFEAEGEMARVTTKGTKSLEAYLKVMQANQLRYVFNPQNLAISAKLAKEAIALDPNYAVAYSVLGLALTTEAFIGQYKDPSKVLAEGKKYGAKAVALDDSSGYVHSALSWTLIMNREYERAISEAQRGVDLEPGSAQATYELGMGFYYSSQYEQSIPWFKRALRLSPVPLAPALGVLGGAYRMLGQYPESITVCKELTEREPDYLPGHLGLAATYMLVGKAPEARTEIAEVLRINPKFSWNSMQTHIR